MEAQKNANLIILATHILNRIMIQLKSFHSLNDTHDNNHNDGGHDGDEIKNDPDATNNDMDDKHHIDD